MVGGRARRGPSLKRLLMDSREVDGSLAGCSSPKSESLAERVESLLARLLVFAVRLAWPVASCRSHLDPSPHIASPRARFARCLPTPFARVLLAAPSQLRVERPHSKSAPHSIHLLPRLALPSDPKVAT